MDNSPRLPIIALIVAAIAALITVLSYTSRETGDVFVLNEVQIGLVALAFTLTIYGIQGLISVLLEGRTLHVGRVRPRLTNPLSLAIVVFSLLLFADSVLLGYGLIDDWGPTTIGLLAGAGSLILALLLVFYKEAFVGDEGSFDRREDGVPW